MPYYIYRVTQTGSIKHLDKLAQFDAFKGASAEAKRLRKESDATAGKIQVIFGENELEAEEALNTVRQVMPLTGDDW